MGKRRASPAAPFQERHEGEEERGRKVGEEGIKIAVTGRRERVFSSYCRGVPSSRDDCVIENKGNKKEVSVIPGSGSLETIFGIPGMSTDPNERNVFSPSLMVPGDACTCPCVWVQVS